MTKIIICAYRDWALEIADELEVKSGNVEVLKIYRTNEDFINNFKDLQTEIEMLLFIGWSWIVPAHITKNFLCLGLHPSDLPYYRGGSPIQNQVINGVVNSKMSLFTLTEKLDSGSVWLKEDLSLAGNNISEIFQNITKSSISLLVKFFEKFPDIEPVVQKEGEGSYFARRKPTDSKIDLKSLHNLSIVELYNKIRCLTDPYPNAYLEDEEGHRLVFKEVEFLPRNNN